MRGFSDLAKAKLPAEVRDNYWGWTVYGNTVNATKRLQSMPPPPEARDLNRHFSFDLLPRPSRGVELKTAKISCRALEYNGDNHWLQCTDRQQADQSISLLRCRYRHPSVMVLRDTDNPKAASLFSSYLRYCKLIGPADGIFGVSLCASDRVSVSLVPVILPLASLCTVTLLV